FKVWGSAANDVYVVGELETIWHLRGSTWSLERQSSNASSRLTTVAGCSAHEVYAVGNLDVLRSDGTTWSAVSIGTIDDNGLNGVACAGPGRIAVVGFAGTKERLSGGRWDDDFSQPPSTDLHAVWADPSGAFWAAGGDFSSDPRAGASRNGVLAYYGSAPPSSTLSP
ncbi:MAG TPA: hypothetical protein VKU41_09715, partial [Polyangiaceae bacterium]|nr:hypothetical protein [Polyangiaceae bacterium]